MRFYLILLLFIFLGCEQEKESEIIFERLSAQRTGIDFSNDLSHDVNNRSNLFDFDYFYNGAGVGVADLNNDGSLDIYFAGNQVDDKLYINKGNFEFRDISIEANLNLLGGWSNGVSFVDINEDGFLDIYISRGGPLEPSQRANLLYVNQGDETFIEKARDYGLADQGFSTQSAFFDFDQDGDLDCLVMNENGLYGTEPGAFYQLLRTQKGLMHGSSSHFYINDGGTYVDATAQVGMLRPSFGLGLSVSDLNGDGWLDIYIANDYFIPDAMYINKKNGTFFDEIKSRTSQISFFGMGVDVADINNDAYQDILVLDMASADHVRSKTLMQSMSASNFDMLVNKFDFAYQYMFNTLQINRTNNVYRNISHQLGIAKTDWSWAGLIADYNNDGNKDVYITNGYRRYASDNDFSNKVGHIQAKYQGKVPMSVKKQLYEEMPSEKLPNLLFENQGNLSFKNSSSDWGIVTPSFSNGAVYADLDRDGDLDLVTNNIDQEAFVHKNLSRELNLGNFLTVKTLSRHHESYAKVYVYTGDSVQLWENKGVRGYFSFVEPVAYFGLGSLKMVDSVRVVWPNGKVHQRYRVDANQELIISETDEEALQSNNKNKKNKFTFSESKVINFNHKQSFYDDFKKEILLPYKQSTVGPSIVSGDVNGDGWDDIFISGSKGQPSQIFIQREGEFEKIENFDFLIDKEFEDIGGLFFDSDGDLDLDLYVLSGGNEYSEGSPLYRDRLYINDGLGKYYRDKNFVDSSGLSGKVVKEIDLDDDGDLDLIVGNRMIPHHYPLSSSAKILLNENGIFKNITEEISIGFREFGIINDIEVTDFNHDGKDDFIVVGEWTKVGMFTSVEGKFQDVSVSYGLDNELGWWFSITSADINGDGLMDYILGNIGLNTKYTASKATPFKVFANDFDTNGTFDIVLSKMYKGNYVPVRGRECTSQQMPFISEKFNTYTSFAQASVQDMFEDKLDSSLTLEVNEFRTLVMLSTSEGFDIMPLPNPAQSFPFLDCAVLDLNDDGLDDLIAIGNIYNTEVETPRWDAGTGMVLLADSINTFQLSEAHNNHFFIEGNAKSIQLLNRKERMKLLIVARNNDSVISFEIKR
jgi:hypothetical protein